ALAWDAAAAALMSKELHPPSVTRAHRCCFPSPHRLADGERVRERGAFAPEVRGMKAPPHPALSPKRAWGEGVASSDVHTENRAALLSCAARPRPDCHP